MSEEALVRGPHMRGSRATSCCSSVRIANAVVNYCCSITAHSRSDVQTHFDELYAGAKKKRDISESEEHQFNLLVQASSAILCREFNCMDPLDIFTKDKSYLERNRRSLSGVLRDC
ncbi:hypothetical protein RF11_03753 [Thelohanellus kitauei]|uniref:Uncharacterized protein n=1 Tax=Thelohanellus kitauei TaxID=669202 RepID=A0A0C2NDZ8_THEKT|nr:hypothetical protein RF11_03753 [Thelohanellus kitauei]